MSEISVEAQQHIFHEPLERAELEVVSTLVNRCKANSALTQQLALDASRLISTSQERLAKQSGAGFCKRFISTISGKTSENQLLNQVDMLKIQRFAWHYLQQLQQQNLINAQSISIIRNNLGTMNDYIIETRDFLELAIDKINHRLQQVENNTSFSNWSLNIEANKRRYKSIPNDLLVLRLSYDFMRSHRDVALTTRDINHLVVTLDKLGINCDDEIELLDFIIKLIDQIEVVGIDQYRAMIELSFDEHTIDSSFIQKNISGIGFNALYFLSEQYEKIIDLVDDNDICNSDEAREKIISKFFGAEFSGLSTKYSIRNLIGEVIGGSLTAIDIYKELNGLNTILDEPSEESQPEVITLISTLPDIHTHTFLDNNQSDESKRNYLRMFSLCLENSASLNAHACDFIGLLAEKSGFPELQKEVIELADNLHKQKEYRPTMLALLDDDEKKYTWLLDVFFLLTLTEKAIENPRVKVILDALKPTQLKKLLPSMLTIVNGNDESQVLEATIKLSDHTQGWKNIIRYRELHFDQYFAEAFKRLNESWLDDMTLNLEITKVYAKGAEHAVFFSFSDGSFLSNRTDKVAAILCTQGRKSTLSDLNGLRKKVKNHISKNRSALSQANNLISRWNIPTFEFEDVIQYSDFDLNNSADNGDWDDQFQLYHSQIENTLNSFSQALADAREQLEFFMKGNFDQSVLKFREQKHAEYLLRQEQEQEQERLEKQTVTIIKDGKEHLFGIEWQKVESPPCDPDSIRHIKTNGEIWFIVASINSDEIFYRSEDGLDWQLVQIDTPDIKIWSDGVDVVNGMWIIKNRALSEGTRDEGFYHSIDAITWLHSPAPEPSKRRLSINDGYMFFENTVYFNGLWIRCGHQYQKYSYTEKGFFSDSTKTDHYRKITLYCAQTLDGPWQPWDQIPQLSEGIEIKKICSLPGKNSLVAFCEYNSAYIRNKKKPEIPPFVMYYGAARAWKNCTWALSANFRIYSDTPFFANISDGLVCFSSEGTFTSEKGYEWKKQEETLDADDYFPLDDLSLFIRNNNSAIYVSEDAKLFKEVMLEEGTWRYLTANRQGILGVHYANKHEETVLRFGNYICADA